jgi:hypothetical protein
MHCSHDGLGIATARLLACTVEPALFAIHAQLNPKLILCRLLPPLMRFIPERNISVLISDICSFSSQVKFTYTSPHLITATALSQPLCGSSMTTIQAAFYARVSGEQQAAAHTIESQIAALSERAHSDGTPYHRSGDLLMTGLAAPRSFAQLWIGCAILLALAHRPYLRPLTRPTGTQLRLPGPASRRVAAARDRSRFSKSATRQEPRR